MTGFVYLEGVEQCITVKNISISGILAQLNSKAEENDIKRIFNNLLGSSIIDLYLPEMRVAGEAQVIRVDMQDDHILIALEFTNISYGVDNELHNRKAYRKNLPGPGQILLDGIYLDFNAVNVSVQGMMVRLNQAVAVELGLVTLFKFERLGLEGEVELMWIDQLTDGGTLMGLQYVHIGKASIKGIREFNWPLTA
jgi:PilZ domain